MKTISEVLQTARHSGPDGGATASSLMRICNLSYRGLEQLVNTLIDAGLLNRLEQDRGVKYAINEKGSAYLELYKQFEAFTESFGLRL